MTATPPFLHAPVILCFSGFDPSGGAGIQADIETITSMGGYCSPIITAMTVQDTRQVYRYEPVSKALIKEQTEKLLADLDIAAIKIGMLGNSDIVQLVIDVLEELPDVPVVLDPVLASGAGHTFADDKLIALYREELIPRTTIMTPNTPELKQLMPQMSNDDAAKKLMESGCDYILLTGGHESTTNVHNILYGEGSELETFTWERMPAMYHGTGCTLAAGVSALLAQHVGVFDAVHEAQEFTHEAIKQAFKVGKGQLIPNRLFWSQPDTEPLAPNTDGKNTN